MAQIAIDQYLKLIPAVRYAPQKYLWSSYDEEADVLYINFKKPSHATDSELTDNDVIIRYEGDAIVGLTILDASKRGIEDVSKKPVPLNRVLSEAASSPYASGPASCS